MVAIRYVGCCGVVMSGLEEKENEYKEKKERKKESKDGRKKERKNER